MSPGIVNHPPQGEKLPLPENHFLSKIPGDSDAGAGTQPKQDTSTRTERGLGALPAPIVLLGSREGQPL